MTPERERGFSVERIAFLARMELTEEEIRELERDLERILRAFEEIREAPVNDLDPLFSVGPEAVRLREDVPEEPLGREVMLRDVPDRYQHFIRVPSPLSGVRKRQ